MRSSMDLVGSSCGGGDHGDHVLESLAYIVLFH